MLKTLEEANREAVTPKPPTTPNGIACPECGAELEDQNGALLMSYPPQIRTRCPKCAYRGTRVA